MRKFLNAVNLFQMPENPTVAGLRLIAVSVANWSLMHILFFGVPRFDNKWELNYTLSNLAFIGMGCFFILWGKRARNCRTPRLPR
jgi:hypothetical protein